MFWVSAEGVIYKDFHKDKHFISSDEANKKNFVKYFVGIDWGYEHPGSIVVMGIDDKEDVYVLEEHTKRHEEIDYWVKVALDIKKEYGNINFFCDSA